jgi:outer membrane protein OmpA-like peptidoglycan-associated protein
MKRFLLPILVVGAMALTVGCATKKNVAQQVNPIINKVDELDERTAQTTRGIHDTDQRAQQGIQGVEAHASAADQKALAAGQQADQAQQLAAKANTGVNDLTNQVVNLDNYHPVTEAAVHFGFNKADLSRKDKQQLDELAQQISSVKGYIVQIEGRTDSVGDANYNYELSQRRAAAVIQYLAAKYNVPAHKVFIIGLGKDAPVEKNTTARGRAENRRVDVRLMTNNLQAENASNQQQPTPSATANPQR